MKRRSYFFPLALVATGAIWLLIDLGRLPAENLWALAHFWPFLLIAVGLGLILRAWWSPFRILLDVLVVGGAVLAILYAPQLGWNTPQWLGLQFNGSISGSGKIVSETRQVSGFSNVEVDYPAQVSIKQGAAESLSIEADDNLLQQLRSRVTMGTLYLENAEPNWGKRVNPSRPVKVTITVKDLRHLGFSSAGSVAIQNLQTDNLSLDVSGAGSITLDKLNTHSLDCHLDGAGSVTANGVADALHLSISGVGNFQGSNLSSQSADVQLDGTGNATVHPKNDLSVDISGLGSVRYFGNPSITRRISGLGGVVKIGE